MVRFLLWLLSRLSLRTNHFIGGLIGRYLYIAKGEHAKIVSKNIKLCFPNLSEKAQQKLIKASLIEAGKGLSELGFVWFRSFQNNAKHVKKINGIAHLQSDQAIILLAPHLGCWEITAPVVSLTRKLTALYKAPKNKQQHEFLLKKRNVDDLHLVNADINGIVKLQRALAKGEMIGILPDQDPGEQGGISAPFFGRDVRSVTLLVKLARRNNAQVLTMWAKRLPKGKGYELNIEPVEVLSSSNQLKDDVALMNQAIEKLIRTEPTQYLWGYKRFKSHVDYNTD